MARATEPVFLARETYRRRRLIDAMRFLPVLGAAFFLVPMLGSGAATRSTALGGLYIFGIWAGLIVLGALMTRRLARAPGGVAADPLEPAPPLAPADAGSETGPPPGGADDVPLRDPKARPRSR